MHTYIYVYFSIYLYFTRCPSYSNKIKQFLCYNVKLQQNTLGDKLNKT